MPAAERARRFSTEAVLGPMVQITLVRIHESPGLKASTPLKDNLRLFSMLVILMVNADQRVWGKCGVGVLSFGGRRVAAEALI